MITFSQLGNYGRFGNQLFQVATVIAHAERVGDEAAFPPWNYSFLFEGPFKFVSNCSAKYYKEPAFTYAPLPLERNLDLFGSFQCEEYFIDYDPMIRNILKPKQQYLQPVVARWSAHLHNSCAVHIRRGDYLSSQEYHPIPTADYYTTTMKLAMEAGTRNFIIISDDTDWCKDNIKGDNISYSVGQTDYEDLLLMSLCTHCIMANSSFSWWGSWLNDSPERLIYTPAKWFGPALPENLEKDVYRKKMIKV